MHKKLERDLMSLAHDILQMKNKEDVLAIKAKAQVIHEKLAVLAHIEAYLNTTPNATETKEELVLKVENSFKLKEENIEKEIFESTENKTILADKTPQTLIIEKQPFDELEQTVHREVEKAPIKKKETTKKTTRTTLDEELQDTVSIDVVADLFQNAVPKSLNDNFHKSIQIGLNDRITFVKNLFEGSQEEFNRVLSQLNTFGTEKEAKRFINKMVKPDYNWDDKEELETRFINLIERKFA